MRVTRSGETLRLELDEQEAGILRQLADEMRTLLDARVPRADPVVARLFPDAYDDPELAQGYDDLVGDELRDEKLRASREVSASLGASGPANVELDDDLVNAWLAWLTDVRLAIGTRLGVTEETMEQEIDPASPEAPAHWVFHHLGWIQESILERLGAPGDD